MKNLFCVLLSLGFLSQTLPAQTGRPYTALKRDNIGIGGGWYSPTDRNSGGPHFYGGYYYEASGGFFVGADMGYSSSESSILGIDHVKTSILAFSTVVKYLLTVGDFDPFLGGALGYGAKHFSGNVTGDQNYVVLAGLGGLMLRVRTGLHVVAEARYNEEFSNSGNNGIGSRGGVCVSVGFQMSI